jgi:hypothetical protein
VGLEESMSGQSEAAPAQSVEHFVVRDMIGDYESNSDAGIDQ